MIKLLSLITEIISEKMNYAQLMQASDPARKDRASRIPAKSLVVRSVNDREAWKFSYKTPRDENTTGLRHQGFIYFFKENMEPGDNAMEIPCSVICSCPDYKYRFSYANKLAGAGESDLNTSNYPSSISDNKPQLCKHLLSLKEFLHTKIEGEPTPENPAEPVKPVAIPASPPPEKTPPEEPEEPEIDPTQTPEPEQEPEIEPENPVEDPTQTPEGPDEEEPETPEEEPEKKEKLKETFSRDKIAKALDEFCKNNKVFVV